MHTHYLPSLSSLHSEQSFAFGLQFHKLRSVLQFHKLRSVLHKLRSVLQKLLVNDRKFGDYFFHFILVQI